MSNRQFGIFLVLCGSVAYVLGMQAGKAQVQSAKATDHAPSAVTVTVASTEAVTATLPTEIKIGDRIYEVLPILQGDEKRVIGHTMVVRAKEANAHLGQEDGEYLLAHQGDIPVALRGEVSFAFTDWPYPDRPGSITIVYWSGDRWIHDWDWLDHDWYGHGRVLRRKSV